MLPLAGLYRRNFSLPILFLVAVSTSIFVPNSYIWLELILGYYTWIYREKLITLSLPKSIRGVIVFIALVMIISARKGAGDFISLSRILFWGVPAIFLFVLIFLKREEDGLLDRISKKYNFSYSLYLTHWIVLIWYSEQHGTSPLVLYSALIGAATLFYLCIERPAHHLSKRVLQ
jgi:peptidoglycan/LPS O-acetylase OafA/YrhL